MTLFLMPVVYAIFNKRSDERKARAEARRERIASGLTAKQWKAAHAAGSAGFDPAEGVGVSEVERGVEL
jgi:HAE1 family hydrophobic/amphiphilic exporter-1